MIIFCHKGVSTGIHRWLLQEGTAPFCNNFWLRKSRSRCTAKAKGNYQYLSELVGETRQFVFVLCHFQAGSSCSLEWHLFKTAWTILKECPGLVQPQSCEKLLRHSGIGENFDRQKTISSPFLRCQCCFAAHRQPKQHWMRRWGGKASLCCGQCVHVGNSRTYACLLRFSN